MVAVDLDYVSRGNSKRIQKQTRVMSFMHFCMCFVCLFEQLFHLPCFLYLDVRMMKENYVASLELGMN